ncbi:mitogen-activated protein kinase kinase kinase 7-like isoform X2 [Tubulanus polymorphus]|uniref:mitogen-activated protein kinase kinase kinase 7-like isoform X2 n=1 Tax=Tubulanus polymorphus TaxID=672921 RepID=UPI003DA4165B
MAMSPGFVEEIDFNELVFKEVVGRGTFGVVSRAQWKGRDVAVKLIETESEKRAFITELKQLSRVNHPNIVQLHGASTVQPVCLVMEYAEGGSLYNVLHGNGPQPEYTLAHAMSWCLQCAVGVQYLHNMKPKALIHRDLKPPNLLLIMGGTILKICDFGTACDIQTHMTNNKGSAAWMAPEVFEGCNYSEKCDVFSWGIILWEVITRKKPFDEIGGPAFRIMWAVHNGTRPPMISNLPKPLEILMTKCWSKDPSERPCMSEVVRIMSHLFQFCKGADKPLVNPQTEQQIVVEETTSGYESELQTNMTTSNTYRTTSGATNVPTSPSTNHQPGYILGQGEPVSIVTPTTPTAKHVVVEEKVPGRTSAPASLAASRESLDSAKSRSSTPSFEFKRYSADLSKLEEVDILSQGNLQKPEFVRGHRRTGSYGNSPLATNTTSGISSAGPSSTAGTPGSPPSATPKMPHVMSAPSDLNGVHSPERSKSMEQKPANLPVTTSCNRSVSWHPSDQAPPPSPLSSLGYTNKDSLDWLSMLTDKQLQPLPPCTSSPESMEIFNQHCKLSQEYLRIQTEIALLTQRRQELDDELKRDEQEQDKKKSMEEYAALCGENESLAMLHKNLKKQVEMLRSQRIRY